MDIERFFSIREVLLDPGVPRECLFRCLVQARRFLKTTSVLDILDLAFEQEENRCSVRESVFDTLHVGFIFSGKGLSLDRMRETFNEAGFGSDSATFPSAVVARELGDRMGGSPVPTTVVTASTGQIQERYRYVEAFIPSADQELVRRWMEEEVGTHVGLTLAIPSALATVQAAFLEQGYRIPSFMHGKPITNLDKNVTVTYFEKNRGGRNVRLEVLIVPPHYRSACESNDLQSSRST